MDDGSGWPGDSEYERLLREHGPALARFAFLLTGNRFDAEDIVQDAIISVASRWRGLAKTAPFGYLRQAVARKAIDLARRRRPSGELDPDIAIEDAGYLRLEQDIEFVRMLRTLPERQRAVLVLRYQQSLDDATIGRILGCTSSTVRSQAARAFVKLREQLAPERSARTGGD